MVCIIAPLNSYPTDCKPHQCQYGECYKYGDMIDIIIISW